MTILVTGATGNVGRQLVEQLVNRRRRVRALTRRPAAANLPDRADVVAGDLAVTETLEPALEGVSAMHLITFTGAEQAPLEHAPEIVRLATKAGVHRVTVLQGGWPGPVEEAVEASDLAWTRLSPVEFMSNALDWADSIKKDGVVREGFPDNRSALVHEADVAAVAATALTATSSRHAGQVYWITGPEALTPGEQVAIIGEAIGRKIEFIPLSQDEMVSKWKQEGFQPEDIDFFLQMRLSPPEESYTVLPTVKRVTGKPARTFAQWAAENADQFR